MGLGEKAVLLTLLLSVNAQDDLYVHHQDGVSSSNNNNHREGKGLITDMLSLLGGFSSVVDELQDQAMGEVSCNIDCLLYGSPSWSVCQHR